MLVVEVVPCWEDNYAYVVPCPDGGCMVIDPTDGASVWTVLAGRRLNGVLCTHHHHDHVGGIAELIERAQSEVPVYGSAHDQSLGRIPHQTAVLASGEEYALFGHRVQVLAVPGHTLGALALYMDDAVFSGDTLFVGGSGRIFEGTPAMMLASLRAMLTFNVSARLFCGHEYTLANLEFARHCEPQNPAIVEAQKRFVAMRKAGLPTVGGALSDELTYNPFLRTENAELRATLRCSATEADDIVFDKVRKTKNGFRSGV
jgi:hydroxyacylglutathione hydrolase